MKPQRTKFELPTSVIFNCGKDEKTNEYFVHCLDFDLVCAASTPEAALNRLCLAVKTYVEYGLTQGWDEYIRFPAPEDVWDEALASEKPIRIIEPAIEIENKRMFVVSVKDASNAVACEA